MFVGYTFLSAWTFVGKGGRGYLFIKALSWACLLIRISYFVIKFKINLCIFFGGWGWESSSRLAFASERELRLATETLN